MRFTIAATVAALTRIEPKTFPVVVRDERISMRLITLAEADELAHGTARGLALRDRCFGARRQVVVSKLPNGYTAAGEALAKATIEEDRARAGAELARWRSELDAAADMVFGRVSQDWLRVLS